MPKKQRKFADDGWAVWIDGDDTSQWNQSREDNLQGQFNFYYNITKDSISRGSMFLYLVLLMAIGVIGDILADYVMLLIDLLT